MQRSRGNGTTFISIKIAEGRKLAAKDRGGTSDPYFVLHAPSPSNSQPVTLQSDVQKKTLEPNWFRTDTLVVRDVSRVDIKAGRFNGKNVVLEVFDWNKIMKHEFMGHAEFNYAKVLEDTQNESVVDFWLPLTERPEGAEALMAKEKKTKGPAEVKGEVRVILTLVDDNLTPEQLEQMQGLVKTSGEKIQELHRAFQERKRDGRSNKIDSVGALTDIFKKCNVLEVLINKWNNSHPEKNQHWDLIKNDPAVMDLIMKQFFDAFDNDKSGSIEFEELIVGLSLLTEGSKEDVLRMHFKSRDKDGDGKLTKAEARELGQLTIALIQAAFMLGIRSQKAKMLEAGLRESDFTPLCDAITDAFKQHDFATIEADLLFKFADVNNDGVVTEDEYVRWCLDESQQAQRKAEMERAMVPVTQSIQANVTIAMQDLVRKLQARFG